MEEKTNNYRSTQGRSRSTNTHKESDSRKKTYNSSSTSSDRRSYSSRSEGNSDRPRRSYSDRKPEGERRTYSSRSEGQSDRPRRSYSDRKPEGERRSYSPRSEGQSDRPRRSYSDRKPEGERRSYSPRSEGQSDRPRRSYSDRKPEGERRSYSPRSEGQSDRPRRSYSDRKPEGERIPYLRDDDKSTNNVRIYSDKENFTNKDAVRDERIVEYHGDIHAKAEKKKYDETLHFENKNVRYYIYKCLCNIIIDRAYSNIDIDHMLRDNDMSEQDKRLFTKVVYGTLQNQNILTWEMKKLSEKAPKDQARIIILMSLYQLRFLDRIPAFAVISEAVDIAKEEQGEFMGKFVNAILREATRQNLNPTREDFEDDYAYLCTIYNTPIWVIKMWERHYGMEQTKKILINNNKEAPLTCRVNVNKASKEEILNNKDFVSGNFTANSLFYIGETPIAQTEEMKNSLISVQDESSQYVVEVLDPKADEHILDMCAAPGSKTQYMAALMNNTGKILALDIHEHRVGIMKSYLDKLNITNTTCVTFDATKISSKEKLLESFDKVLLDAPCTGLGVVRRKPDIIIDLSPEKLDEICLIQQKLLQEAYKMLKVGGTLVYSTCTMNKKENDAQITTFISHHPDMKRVFERQIFPDEYNSDGFYVAKLIKE